MSSVAKSFMPTRQRLMRDGISPITKTSVHEPCCLNFRQVKSSDNMKVETVTCIKCSYYCNLICMLHSAQNVMFAIGRNGPLVLLFWPHTFSSSFTDVTLSHTDS
jgi:hypothetical protein